jgi:GNAT superfamily N-acetyltransferase
MNYTYKNELLNNKDKIQEMLPTLLNPVKKFNEEKIQLGMYDDWNEYLHDKNTYTQIAEKIEAGENYNLYAYYIEYNNEIIATVFFINSKETIENIVKNSKLETEVNYKSSVQLSGFHITKEHRGIGMRWLKERVFPNLIENGYNTVYVKSSHYKAFSFYEKLGYKIGKYIGISDNKLYQRLGNIYVINIK